MSNMIAQSSGSNVISSSSGSQAVSRGSGSVSQIDMQRLLSRGNFKGLRNVEQGLLGRAVDRSVLTDRFGSIIHHEDPSQFGVTQHQGYFKDLEGAKFVGHQALSQ